MSLDTMDCFPQRLGSMFDDNALTPQHMCSRNPRSSIFNLDSFLEDDMTSLCFQDQPINPLYSNNIQNELAEMQISNSTSPNEFTAHSFTPEQLNLKKVNTQTDERPSSDNNNQFIHSQMISESLPNRKIQTGRFTISVSPPNSGVDIFDNDENSISVSFSKIRPQKSSGNLIEHTSFPVQRRLIKAQSESRFKISISDKKESPPLSPIQHRSFSVDVSVEPQFDSEKQKTIQFFDDLIDF